jgi:methionyl-tRNA synthetase
MPRKILVTSALPYANHHIHMGHMLEYIQTDIWVRFQRLQGNDVRYFCADDTHGTSIMIRARKEGRRETELIAETSQAHQRDFAAFGVSFDHYGSTHSDTNRQLCDEFWQALRKAGAIVERDVSQLFDTQAGTFLADRFVTGTCPKCQTPNQYGDSCESCGSTYSPADLIDPKSTLSGTKPEVRSSKHLFVTLEKYHPFLDDWTQKDEHLQPSVANYLKGHFLSEPLRDWDVSRPAPYFGFEIPDSPGNYWYVWFDAPIGYLASTSEWCAKNNQKLDDWWKNSDVEIHHFIGKDITYFHTLFWPAMLKAAGYSLPKRVNVHGFLTVNGQKMSKSKGTFIMASTYLQHMDPAYLRYYYASKLSSRVDDLDLDAEDFIAKVNSDLVGKVVNLASRTARFVEGVALATDYPEDGGLFEDAAKAGAIIAAAYENREYSEAMRGIMALADRANEYIDRMQPWTLKKQPDRQAQLLDVCTVALNLYRQLAIYLTPVLPKLAEMSGRFLNSPIQRWSQANKPLLGSTVSKFEHLMERADMKKMQTVIEASVVADAPTTAGAPAATEGSAATSSGAEPDYGQALISEPLAPECTIDDFTKVDLRVAEIIKAEEVPEAKKLLKLTVSLGGQIQRTVFAGIKAAYEPQSLVGRRVIVVANLKPRTMKFGTSEAMVLAAGPGEKDVFLLSPDTGAKPGQRVH